MSIRSVMPSNHLILCHPLLFLPSIFPSIRVFSSESVLRIRWPKYWEFQLQHQSYQWDSGLISFRMDSLFKINLEKKKERRYLQPWTWHREPGLKIFPQGTTPAPSAGTPEAKPGSPTGCRPLRKPVTLPAPESGPIWHWLLCLLLHALILWCQLTLMKVTWENCGV